tara:strand:- start:1375 stop:2262 length:888 start_codon:yes stop_codon:yes gene_type:complete
MKQLEFDDFSLTYSTEGEGSDILLLHGFPSNIFFWNSLKAKLINNYRVTTVEQRGYPLSSLQYPKKEMFTIDNLCRDIEKLIDTEGLNRNLIIVGHDWGSIVAWAVASRAEVKITKLVSICGGTEFPQSRVYDNLNFKNGVHYISTFQNAAMSSSLIENNLDMFFRSAYRVTPSNVEEIDLSLKTLFMNTKESSFTHDINIDSLTEHFREGLIQQIYWYANIDINQQISSKWRRRLNIPVDFLFGANDVAVQLNPKMRDRLSHSGELINIMEVSNADHWLPLTHEESVIERIKVL